jgi:hypothetical protein
MKIDLTITKLLVEADVLNSVVEQLKASTDADISIGR